MGKFYKKILIHFLPIPTFFHRMFKDAGEQEPHCILIIERQLLPKDFKASCQTLNYISQLASLQKGVSPFSQEVFRKERFLHCKVIMELKNCSQKGEEQEDRQEPSPKLFEH